MQLCSTCSRSVPAPATATLRRNLTATRAASVGVLPLRWGVVMRRSVLSLLALGVFSPSSELAVARADESTSDGEQTCSDALVPAATVHVSPRLLAPQHCSTRGDVHSSCRHDYAALLLQQRQFQGQRWTVSVRVLAQHD
jgi:hypothetical protein